MADVTVDSHDLEILVKLLWECSTESRAHRAVRVHQIPTHQEAVMRYLEAFESELPQARKDEYLRYVELLNSLETGDSVRRRLANFAARGASSVAAFERKARRKESGPGAGS
jgi:hypothetical protein